jgi:hypothetical protein
MRTESGMDTPPNIEIQIQQMTVNISEEVAESLGKPHGKQVAGSDKLQEKSYKQYRESWTAGVLKDVLEMEMPQVLGLKGKVSKELAPGIVLEVFKLGNTDSGLKGRVVVTDQKVEESTCSLSEIGILEAGKKDSQSVPQATETNRKPPTQTSQMVREKECVNCQQLFLTKLLGTAQYCPECRNLKRSQGMSQRWKDKRNSLNSGRI